MGPNHDQRFYEAAAGFRRGNSRLFDEWESFSTRELEAYAKRLGLIPRARITRTDLTRRLRDHGVTPPLY